MSAAASSMLDAAKRTPAGSDALVHAATAGFAVTLKPLGRR